MRYLAWMLVTLSCLTAGCGGGDRGDTQPAPAPVVNATVTPDDFLTFINTSTEISSVAYANAYYSAVDPGQERTTLDAWKTINGFDQGDVVHSTFRDAKDLGYGRDMYARTRSDGGIAIYVDNYVVELEAGDATSYGPLNLDAAINRERKYHFGTNAIEFSADPTDPTQRIAKFFTFGPLDANGVQPRITSADLDGRGVKHMPTMCVVCHGGTMYPLQNDGRFDPISLESPKMHILEQDSLEFSALVGYREADQQAAIKAINALVHQTYQGADADADQANWSSAFAEELVTGAYGGGGFPTTYQEDFVPAGWTQTVSRPDGVEILYKRVIAPHCIGCHSLRGTQVAENIPPSANAVNFSSYEKFISYNDRIIDYVYRRGSMPRSLINFSQFWEDPDGAPTLLATYLAGFDLFDVNGKVVMPGKSVAIPGTDRTVKSPATLDASASMFTDTYAWRIVSTPPVATASLSSTTGAAPVLIADTDGDYVIELITANVMGTSDPEQITITIDSTLSPSQTELTFVSDIMSSDGMSGVFGSGGANCAACHTSAAFAGIPVYYATSDYAGHEKDLYRNVLNRIDLNDPENSLLLRKPTSLQHGGGIVLDRTNPALNALYLKLLNWIRNGAPCGVDATYCE